MSGTATQAREERPRTPPAPSACGDDPRRVLALELTMPSDPRLIDDMAARVSHLLDGTPCGAELERAELPLHEALANAVIHGNGNNVEKPTRIRLEVSKDCGMLMTVRDDGSGFDPESLPDPAAPEGLARPHGRGVFLIKHLMDGVRFRFERGTEVSMWRGWDREK